MSSSPYRLLSGVLNEATVLDANVDVRSREARLRLGVLIAGPADVRPERLVVLREVSRVAAWLRRIEYSPDPDHFWSRPGHAVQVPRDVFPPEHLDGIDGLNLVWREWFGHEIYEQPLDMFDVPEQPQWMTRPSVDVRLAGAGTSQAHTLDLWFDVWRGEPRMLDIRIEFGRLDVLKPDGSVDSVEDLAAAVTQWWSGMHAGRTGAQYGIVPGGEPPKQRPG
jgi:hypothetical protein